MLQTPSSLPPCTIKSQAFLSYDDIGLSGSGVRKLSGYHDAMPIDLRSLAREGARQRIQELLAELAAIRRSFPDLGSRTATVSRSVATPKRRGRRRPMSAAERKAVGIRMKAYWAARRKAAARA